MSEKKKKPTDYMKETPFITLSDQAMKTRRNMLLCMVLCWAQVFNIGFGSKTGTFQVFGNELLLETWQFNFAICVLTGYFIVYFMMQGRDMFLKWRLRSTGLKDSRTQMTKEGEDGLLYDSAPGVNVHQSTAWPQIEEEIDSIRSKIKKIDESDIPERLEQLTKENTRLTNQDIKTFRDKIVDLHNSFANFDEKVSPCLIAFDKTFWKHQKKCKRMFYYLDYGGPLVLSILAVIALLARTFWLDCPVWDVFPAANCPNSTS